MAIADNNVERLGRGGLMNYIARWGGVAEEALIETGHRHLALLPLPAATESRRGLPRRAVAT